MILSGGRLQAAPLRSLAGQVRDTLAWTDVRCVVALFLLAQILDGITTYLALTSQRFQEANPLFGSVMDRHPIAGVTLKFAVASVVAVGLLAVRLRWRMRLIVIFLFAVASFAAPVANALRLAGITS